MAGMDDLVAGDQANANAKAMRSLLARRRAYQRMGFDTDEADLLIKGEIGGLTPEEEDAYMGLMTGKMRYLQGAMGVPGMQKSLRSWPPGGQSKSQQMQQRMQDAFGKLRSGGTDVPGGNGMSLKELMESLGSSR